MSLLLLFAYPAPLSIPVSEAVATEPTPSYGYAIDRPATSGEWRMVLELGDPSAGDAFTWHDVTQFYAGDAYQRGADDYLGRYRAAVAQVQLQTDNDDLAPWGQDTSALFGVDVTLDAGLLMRLGMIRVVAGVVEQWDPIWTGRVESWGDASFARGQIRTHIVTVTDTIGDLANVPVVIASTATNWDTWFTDQLLPAANWLFGVDIYGDTTSAGLPFQPTATAAISLMDAGTDPLGLVWRSTRTGRLIIYPAPWDTTNVDRWPNPLLDVYPSGLVFSFSPDFTDIAYIADDEQQPFGITRTSLGVLNSFQVTMPVDLGTEVYAVDDPVSVSRYGVRPYTASWILSNPPVVDDLLAARAYSSSQALPLRTSLDQEGFWSALAIIDHLDPVTVVHATADDGLVVTATGVVRNVTEQRTVRGIDDNAVSLLSWESTVQIDLNATETAAMLLPVENLALVATNTPLLGGSSSAEFSWTNPVQPSITPTDVQVRMLPSSFIWNDIDYPGVGADGTSFGYLQAATPYTLQVRLIRRVGGVITNFSPIRSVRFTTPALIVPVITPGDDGNDGTNVGIPPDFGCDTEWHIEENDGTGWTVFMSGDQNDLVLGADGLYHLPTDIDNGDFDPANIYRVCYRVDCGDGFGPWICGAPTTIPDDWTDPCTTPPALSDPPFDDPSLILYVPKICAPDIIREAVSGIEAVHGAALAGIVQMFGLPDSFALQAIADPGWSDTPGGIIAYGECPQIVGVVADKTLTIQANIAQAEYCTLGETSGMRLTCTPDAGGWKAGAYVATPTGDQVCLSGVLDLDTVYVLRADYEQSTGTLTLVVDGVFANSVSFGEARDTVDALPIWRVGAPPDSWITDFALFDGALSPVVPTTDLVAWYDAADTATITTSGSVVTQWNDKSGNAHHLTVPGGGTGPNSGTRTRNGLNVVDSPSNTNIMLSNSGFTAPTTYTIFAVCVQDTTAGGAQVATVAEFAAASQTGLRISVTASQMASTSDSSFVTGSAYTNGTWRQITGEHKSAGQTMSLWQNGTLVGTATPAGGTAGSFAIFQLAVGGFAELDGAIAEILIYSPNIGSTQRNAVEAYLVGKWGAFP